MKKILMISHAHPDFSKGGGEIAAYNLFSALNDQKNIQAFFLARHNIKDLANPSHPISSYRRANEYLYYSDSYDGFNHSQAHKRGLWKYFAALLLEIQPEIVHLHHFLHFGIEIIRVIRNTLPKVKIIFTLHEYLAICHHNGQMIKPKTYSLCHQSSPLECHQCCNEYSPEAFFLREQFLKSMLDLVDIFISPSHFLSQRYADWGIKESKMKVIENIIHFDDSWEYNPQNKSVESINFGFFGKLSPYKGIDFLLNTLSQLPQKLRDKCHFTIHGSDIELQSKAFQKQFKRLIKKNNDIVSFYGQYQQNDLTKLMQPIDWIIVPSIWWENSPLVIQEAFYYKKPVLCSNIGGMAEKVIDKKNGIHFETGNRTELIDKIGFIIEQMSSDSKFYSKMVKQIKPITSAKKIVQQHLACYQ